MLPSTSKQQYIQQAYQSLQWLQKFGGDMSKEAARDLEKLFWRNMLQAAFFDHEAPPPIWTLSGIGERMAANLK